MHELKPLTLADALADISELLQSGVSPNAVLEIQLKGGNSLNAYHIEPVRYRDHLGAAVTACRDLIVDPAEEC